ncbi:MEKHLA domain-containing protein [Paenibacillus endoradicis]|uniref:MEKHLA domain-containing protein n=1 Tax=Paenibacillus endoradicis TaxID=2972487 RepID=UPI002158C4ED|nr:MEKHLA domain-containing protein [Paenibacillus endoradicis]MCR8659619.1 MEKHLA domain-containing protein [Paenibacillus endoradicis]
MTESHARLLIHSYNRWTGNKLVDEVQEIPLLDQLNKANCIILSHGTEADPILNYGNERAMLLWEMTEEQFTSTPSRLTAEPMERVERANFMSEVTNNGYVANYTGVRISSSGKRFYIKKATVWNLIDERGKYCGQAATFSDYEYINNGVEVM